MKIRKFTKSGGIDWNDLYKGSAGFWIVNGVCIEVFSYRIYIVASASRNTPDLERRFLTIYKIK
jgi:hypothetical protein